MGQEFTINSALLEAKFNSLLPSQGGYGAGVDLSASTQIIPIIDLTDQATGAALRQDLQTAFSHNNTTPFFVGGVTNQVIINTTGYYRIFGNYFGTVGSAAILDNLNLFDGSSAKIVYQTNIGQGFNDYVFLSFDFVIFLGAGDSLRGTTSNVAQKYMGAFRQIADITGTLSNPT